MRMRNENPGVSLALVLVHSTQSCIQHRKCVHLYSYMQAILRYHVTRETNKHQTTACNRYLLVSTEFDQPSSRNWWIFDFYQRSMHRHTHTHTHTKWKRCNRFVRRFVWFRDKCSVSGQSNRFDRNSIWFDSIREKTMDDTNRDSNDDKTMKRKK